MAKNPNSSSAPAKSQRPKPRPSRTAAPKSAPPKTRMTEEQVRSSTAASAGGKDVLDRLDRQLRTLQAAEMAGAQAGKALFGPFVGGRIGRTAVSAIAKELMGFKKGGMVRGCGVAKSGKKPARTF